MKSKLKNIPKTPGIYQFFDKSGKIIYIGKSVNLFSRVNSYYNGTSKLNFAKQKMVKQIVDIKTIICENETESLILETTLIKKHLPKYNILMKDGKNHVYLKITDEPIAKLIKTREKTNKGSYFGPYISTNYINNILKITKKVFGHRSCNIIFGEEKGKLIIRSKNGTKIPCMDYYINRCSGPCLLQDDKINTYKKSIENIKLFMKGDINNVIKNLVNSMKIEAGQLNFEEAGKIKEDIESIKSLQITQNARESINGNYKVINYIEKYENFYIGLIEIEDSKIIGYNNYEIKANLGEAKDEILKIFIESDFITNNIKYIYLLPEKIDLLNEIIFEIPKIGTKIELLKFAYKNIYDYAYKKHLSSLSTKGFSKSIMKNILEILGYKQINKNIIFECNDISHISGNHTVASRSIIENGKTNTSKYKKFKIKNLEEGKVDDFNSMREIITRRIKEIEKLENIPDLIIIDGGKGQLSSVVEILKENNIDIQVVGIAKKEEELFLPGAKESIILEKNSNELRLIQKIRDEAHRFAITFNRNSRIKSMKKNILEQLPGFGPTTRKKILNKYGSIEKLSKVNIEELSQILNKSQIQILEDHGLV